LDRKQHLADVLSEFARTLVTDFPIQAILDHLVVRIVDVLPVTAAGVSLISKGQNPRYVAASDPSALRFEQLQSELAEGPCLIAFRSGEAVSAPDLRNDNRFPNFGPQALAAGLVGVFSYPLRHDGQPLGALDVYRDTTGPLDEETMEAAQTLADVVAAYLINAQARADLRDSVDRFRESSLHDALTGLPNRILLRQRLDHAILRARRSHHVVAILFADLDRFKEVNDTYGHHVGDELLIAVGQRLNRLLRPGDTLARMSGDEFVILCEDLDEAVRVKSLAARIGTALATPFVLSGREIQVSASVGVAFAGRGEDIPERVLQDADAAMYEAKRMGGARHQVVDLREQHLAGHRATLTEELAKGWSRQLRTDYQPIVTTAGGRLIGVEALLRWDHPVRGLMAPSSVVPLAEQTGLLTSIGQWVLEDACLSRQRWQAADPASDLQIAVNVSAHQLMAAEFCELVEGVLRTTGTPAAKVTLEVTESVFVEDRERALMVLEDLKHLGVMLALDNFGTGYSSLSYLKHFPVDVLKIDRGFIAEMGRDRGSSAIVSAVIDLAHALGMSVVAVGVETGAQYREIAALGCESAQGYYFARPMSAGGLHEQLERAAADGELRLPLRVSSPNVA
jgi:diguanylate cyclase (GGDEF)-like protein